MRASGSSGETRCDFVSTVPGELRRHASTRWKLPLLLQTKDYDLNHMGEKKKKDCTIHAVVFVLFFLLLKFLIRCWNKKEKKMLSISSLCFSSMHCLLFAMWVSSFQKPKALVAQERKMNAKSFCLFGRLVIFFFTVTVAQPLPAIL